MVVSKTDNFRKVSTIKTKEIKSKTCVLILDL